MADLLPVCDGNGTSQRQLASLAAIELAFDSNVFSCGSGAFFDSSVSINAEFFGASWRWRRSMNVSSDRLVLNRVVGERNAAKGGKQKRHKQGE